MIDTDAIAAADTLAVAEQMLNQLEAELASSGVLRRFACEALEDAVGKAIVEAASWRDLRGLEVWRKREGSCGAIVGLFDAYMPHLDRPIRHVWLGTGDHDRLDRIIVSHDEAGIHQPDHPEPGWRAALEALRQAPVLTEAWPREIHERTAKLRGRSFAIVLPSGSVADLSMLLW